MRMEHNSSENNFLRNGVGRARGKVETLLYLLMGRRQQLGQEDYGHPGYK